jgi:hypothetical protein
MGVHDQPSCYPALLKKNGTLVMDIFSKPEKRLGVFRLVVKLLTSIEEWPNW